jgi:hypothetical protein
VSNRDYVAFDLSRRGGAPDLARLPGHCAPDVAEAFDAYRDLPGVFDRGEIAGARSRIRRLRAPAEAGPLSLRGRRARAADSDPNAAERAFDAAIAIGHAAPERSSAFHLWRARAATAAGRRSDALGDYRLARWADRFRALPPSAGSPRVGARAASASSSASPTYPCPEPEDLMRIRETGLAPDEILSTLESYRAADTDWRAGKTWGYVFDAGREIEAVAKRAFNAFMSENALDPTIYPSLLRIENEVVGMALAHLSAPEGAVGNFTSGGTESIILAVKAARDLFREQHPGAGEPELLLPVTAHAAFHKAAHYLGVRVVPVPVDPRSYKADVSAARKLIGPQTMLVVGSAPSYAQGVIDPISELAALAAERGVPCHVDACIGGFLLPYFARLGRPVPAFDFRVPGVTSISMDLHK